MKIFMFVGDLHGDLHRAQELIGIAVSNKCNTIIQVGDWGFAWPRQNEYAKLSVLLKAAGVEMFFCDGNHDDHPVLRQAEKNALHNFSPNITYQHRGTKRKFEDGTVMVFLGGAPSIDYRGRTKGVSWWEEENITEEEAKAAIAVGKDEHVHVLVTHDAIAVPRGLKETSDMSFNYKSRISTGFIKEVMESLRPDMHVHGHYHVRLSYQHYETKIEGLASNIDSIEDNFLIWKRKEANDSDSNNPSASTDGLTASGT